MVHAEKAWQKKGFGWIPDLPDVTDPNLESVLENKPRIHTQEGIGHLEAILEHLIDSLQQQEGLDTSELQDIKKQLSGETCFPSVQIYKILRAGRVYQGKEVVRLKLAIYAIYKKYKEEGNHIREDFIQCCEEQLDIKTPGLNLIQWIQEPTFDQKLEKLVIAFQASQNLVCDGIVGPRSYAAIQSTLTENEQAQPEIALICPPSLIPHEVLKEIFQNLTYLWLEGKFKIQLDNAFLQFFENQPLDPILAERIQLIRRELDNDISEVLLITSIKLREDTDTLKDSKKLQEHQGSLSESEQSDRKEPREELQEKLEAFCASLLQTIQGLTGYDPDKTQAEKQGNTDTIEYPEKTKRILSKLNESIRDCLDQLMENSEALTNSFILCSYERFIYQFEYWFQTIEPFISAILQAISPLANFDNLKEAVNKGFERLDSGFQLHHLENRTRLAPYKTLLSEYSPIYLTDPIAELRSLKYSATNLFEETLVKIERELYGNIEIRPIFIDTLADFSRDRGVLSKKNKDAFLKKVEETVRSEFGYTEDELNTLVKPAAIKFLEFRTRPDRDKDAGEDLQNEKKDLEEYLSFFQFLKDILSNQYNVKYTRAQAESDKVDKQTAVLKSLLTDKEEFFEISHSDLDEQASKGSASSSKIQRTEQALFFEPARLQLPVSTKLLNTSLQRRKKNIKSYFFLPGVVDLSYWCSPVEDQGSLNACTAFAGIALVEYFARKRYGKYMNLSPRFLYKASRNLMGRLDDTGASVRQTMKALVLFGVPPEEVWPWNDQEFNEEPPAFCYAYAQSYQALKYFRLDSAAIASKELLLFQIKAVLAAGLPCMFGLTVYDSFYKESNIRRGHIPYPSDRDQIVGGHAAVAIGYSDYKLIDRVDGKPTQPGAILIRNSWGANWGNGGYGWLPYEYILQGLTADWWSLLKSEWFDGGAFGLGAVDPGATKNNGGGKDENHVTDPPTRT